MKKNFLYRRHLYSMLVLVSMASSFTLKAQKTIESKINEVYGELNGDFFKGNDNLHRFFTKLLTERIKIIEESYNDNEKYIKISSLTLTNKYNPLISHENFKSINEFNPLIYQMDFFAKTTKVYRIDNTDLIIVIDPQ